MDHNDAQPVPEIGELWEVVFSSQSKYEVIRQLKLIRKTEMTYTFVDPDDDPYYPVLNHVLIRDCVLRNRIDDDCKTKPVGLDQYYNSNSDPPALPAIQWSFDPLRYEEFTSAS